MILNEDTVFGGEFHLAVKTGNDNTTGGVDEPVERVVEDDLTVSIDELADIRVDGRGYDGAVLVAEAVEIAFASGLNAVDISNVATARRVGLIGDFLRP